MSASEPIRHSRPAARRHRLVWGSMLIVAHHASLWAITWTSRLFGWLLLSYMVVWGWAVGITRQPRTTLFRGLACTLTLAAILACLELPVLLKLVHWRLVLSSSSETASATAWPTGLTAS